MRCSPLRLPEKTSFCPDCLWLMPTELWEAARCDLPCHGCALPLSYYSTSATKYERRRKCLSSESGMENATPSTKPR